MSEAPKRKPVDWEGVEREYRAGIRSLQDIGSEFGISAPGILKRARRDKWERDLSAKIRAKAEARVNAELVNASVNAETKAAERSIIEANAEALVTVIRGHHKSLGRLSGIIQLLFDRLEAELQGTELFARLGELMASGDESTDKLSELYRKVISLPSQTDTAKKLADALKTHIELERKVFKIEEPQVQDNPLSRVSSERLRRMLEMVGGDAD